MTSKNWKELSFVAFDTETSGAYPVGYDIVEFGAVKWSQGRQVGRLELLFRPREPMSEFIIGIHGITNEMVSQAPLISEKIEEIKNFFDGSVLMAHHAPFDMGFIAYEFEKNKIEFPKEKVICTSLLSRAVFPNLVNHKLQTLIKIFDFPKGAAHRAGDDAEACLQVGLKCMEKLGDVGLDEIYKKMGKALSWGHYSLKSSEHPFFEAVISATLSKKDLDISYQGGSAKNEMRRISPIGIVRNPDGDFIMAKCHRDGAQKRFYISKIKDLQLVF